MLDKMGHVVVEKLTRLQLGNKNFREKRKEKFCQILRTQNLIHVSQFRKDKQLLKTLDDFIQSGLNGFVFYFDDKFSVNDVRNVIPLTLSSIREKHLDVDFHYACLSLTKL